MTHQLSTNLHIGSFHFKIGSYLSFGRNIIYCMRGGKAALIVQGIPVD